MADFADKASDYTERHNAEALENRVTYQGESAEYCVDCDAKIPARRRQAIPGVQRCVDCQQLAEHPNHKSR